MYQKGFKSINTGLGSKGFSLIELMIGLAIVAILATVGGTSYQSYVERGNRSDVQRVMTEIAAKQEQYMMVNQSYTGDLGPTGLNYDINSSISENYTVIVVPYGTNPERYYVRALGINQMAGETLYLYSTGQKSPIDLW